MGWGRPVKLGEDTLSALRKMMEELKLESPNQAVKRLLEVYEVVKNNLKSSPITCPYCEAIGFQSTIQLRKHIAKKHWIDFLMDWKKYG